MRKSTQPTRRLEASECQQARDAIALKCGTVSEFSKKTKIARSTVTNFLEGRSISSAKFCILVKALGLKISNADIKDRPSIIVHQDFESKEMPASIVFTIQEEVDENGVVEVSRQEIQCRILSSCETEFAIEYYLDSCPINSEWHQFFPFVACLTQYKETGRVGLYAQWEEERTIGDLDYIDVTVSSFWIERKTKD